MSDDLQDIPEPTGLNKVLSADKALMGTTFPPQQQLLLYSEDQWEDFVHEWVHYCLKSQYVQVQRFSGAGDRGIDVAGFTDARKLAGVWDNYQCKHYDHALYPTDAWPEIGKMLWYSFKGQFTAPRRYYFVSPQGVGTTLNGYIADAKTLKAELKKNWEKYCKTEITKKAVIELQGEFLDYVDAFDFTIFEGKTALELVEGHKKCPFHAARFGGGLPDRPTPATPPEEIAVEESRYVAQLLDAYADHKKEPVADIAKLNTWPKLRDHFLRQRVAFYHAESLRIFARDSVPPGTFESFQEEIFTSVVDVCDAAHPDGYARVCAVTKAARDLNPTSNALLTRAKLQDRDGICHQLANEDRLKWTDP